MLALRQSKTIVATVDDNGMVVYPCVVVVGLVPGFVDDGVGWLL